MRHGWLRLTVAGMLGLGLAGQAQMATMPMATEAKTPSVVATSLVVRIGDQTTTFSVADLRALPQRTIAVHNEHTKAEETYTGVALGDLLAKCGFPVDKTTHQKMLRSYLRAEGTDKYWVLYSVTEVEGSEHTGDVMVATDKDGKGLGADGGFKLIASGDKRPERWVRNLASITLQTAQ